MTAIVATMAGLTATATPESAAIVATMAGGGGA